MKDIFVNNLWFLLDRNTAYELANTYTWKEHVLTLANLRTTMARMINLRCTREVCEVERWDLLSKTKTRDKHMKLADC